MMLYVIFLWICFSILIAIIGKNRKIGFGFALMWCFILSPIIGLIIVLLSEKPFKERDELINKLNEIKLLYESDILSKEEFEKEKKILQHKIKNASYTNKTSPIHYFGIIILILFSLLIGWTIYRTSTDEYKLEQQNAIKEMMKR